MDRIKKVAFDRISFLVVDDSSHTRHLVRTILYTFGSRTIYEAEDGAQGLEIIESHSPDIIIVDCLMPMLDGFELIQLVRNPVSCKNAFVPIIMLSGHSQKHRVLSARDVGVTEFLCKPISTKLLYERIESVIRKPRQFVQNDYYFGPDKRLDENGRRYGPAQCAEEEDDEFECVETPERFVQRWETFLV